ncbi:MAG: flagellar hook-basal body complex protein [Phycisphaerales bacterium]|jgi:flagellar hook protein FlgE
MPSTTALFTALTGLNAASRDIEVIGNNIANVNTTAYKSTRIEFSTIYSRTLSAGTAPGTNTGGTNPYQIGLGVNTAGTLRNTTAGTLSSTGDDRDLAVDGKGYFVVNRGTSQFFTRDGAFRTNAEQKLTTVSGERVQGYGIDSNYNILPGTIGDITIPVNNLTIAQATKNVTISGNLNSSGALPTHGTSIKLGPGASLGFTAIPGAVPAPTAPNLAEPTTRLIDIADANSASGTSPLFGVGQSISIAGAQKGGKTLPTASYPITATSTIDDLTAFFTQALGINTTVGSNPDGATPGVSLDPATGVLSIIGNTGTTNNLSFENSDLSLKDASGLTVGNPFVSDPQASADGEAVRTSFQVYDSLGAPVNFDVTLAIESRSSTGTVWRYFVETTDPSGQQVQAATGTQAFNNLGQALDSTPVAVSVDRPGTGATSPLTFDISFSSSHGGLSSLDSATSELAIPFRDGSSYGILVGYGVESDGVISGVFSNSEIRPLGQLALASFNNQDGLVDAGDNLFTTGANSGSAVISPPGGFGTGAIRSGSLEQSNVDLSGEFIKLVQASTGFSASSRIIKTTDDLMQQLLALGR